MFLHMNIYYSNFVIGMGLSFSWKFNFNHIMESEKHKFIIMHQIDME